MTSLAPDLFQRRFQDLMEIGRARLPSLAPAWTDHNAHDPGITLMELLAWVSEAQLYSLSRLRRDERAAYAALMGISPAGTTGASGLIWPDRQDPNSPAATFVKSAIIRGDAAINVVNTDNPLFRVPRPFLFAPGAVVKLETRGARVCPKDHTRANQQSGIPFLPFGEGTGRDAVLSMTFQCRDKSGLFGSNRAAATGAVWPIGVLVAPQQSGSPDDGLTATQDRSPLAASLVVDGQGSDLKIASDTTRGLLTTGTIQLDLDEVTTVPRQFTLEFRVPGGLPRPPRVLRIEPNVIPIVQGQAVVREVYVANGMPDWSFVLEHTGLQYRSNEEPIVLEVVESAGLRQWTRQDRLSDFGPDDMVYELDVRTGEVAFGNGINGRIPAAGSEVLVSYSVSDGVEGNVSRNRRWSVAGFPGTFGINVDPIAGGQATADWIDSRREARERLRAGHALVTAADIVTAATSLPLLEVARAWVPKPPHSTSRMGVVTLVAMSNRTADTESDVDSESPVWLEAIRRSLAPRMPLGMRLIVVGPRYVDFSINAVLQATETVDPAKVATDVTRELKRRLALVASVPGAELRQPGVPVTRRDVAAWMLGVKGVKRIVLCELRTGDGQKPKQVLVPGDSLPKWDFGRSKIEIQRSQAGRER